MIRIFVTILLLSPFILAAQTISESSKNEFIDSSRVNDSYYGVTFRDYYLHINRDGSTIKLERLNRLTMTSMPMMERITPTSNRFNINNIGHSDTIFWFIDYNWDTPRPEAVILSVNRKGGGFQLSNNPVIFDRYQQIYSTSTIKNNTFHLWNIQIPNAFASKNVSHLRYKLLPNRNLELEFANNFDVNELLRVETHSMAGQNDSLTLFVLDDKDNTSLAYITLNKNTNAIQYDMVPYQFSEDKKSFDGFHGSGHITESGFINHHKFQTQNGSYKAVLAGYDKLNSKWIYSDKELRNTEDSIPITSESNLITGPISKLPNGDFIAVSVAYQDYQNTIEGGNAKINLIAKIYSNENSPTTKAILIFDNPNNFVPATMTMFDNDNVIMSGTTTSYTNPSTPKPFQTFWTFNTNTYNNIEFHARKESLQYTLTNENNTLNIKSDKTLSIEIFDSMGRSHFYTSELNSPIDIQTLPKGLYIIRAKTQDSNTWLFSNFIK